MPETASDKTIFSLSEVTRSIQKTLAERYKSAYWIKAEMNKLNFYSHSGHCYPELVEKREGKIIAQVKSILWKDDYGKINQKFLSVLKEPLKDGIKILFLAKITFDPSYGLSLQIIDIDPAYTLGDLEKEKQETISKLRAEGIYDENKKLSLALLPQRIAIISVETSKGYADFLQVIDTNQAGYKLFHMLFPSLLQGDKAADSIIGQLNRIRKVISHFDAVAIIRGGGGDIGLSCYNNYSLAKAIATFPIPVLTGIGHATNETVSEMISFANEITPTRLGEMLIRKFRDFDEPVKRARERLSERSKRLLSDQRLLLQAESRLFRSATESIIARNKNDLATAKTSVLRQAQFIFKSRREYLNSVAKRITQSVNFYKNRNISTLAQLSEKLRLHSGLHLKNDNLAIASLEKSVGNLDPANVLKRGYSITYLNGKAVRDASIAKQGDILSTIIYTGEIVSAVKDTIHGTTR